MTQKERLVELLNEIHRKTLGKEYLERLGTIADYLLENGVIVPPCKSEDKIYCDGKYFASHCAGKIMEFPVSYVETNVVCAFRGEKDVSFDFDELGESFFLTKEEAERALAERNGQK